MFSIVREVTPPTEALEYIGHFPPALSGAGGLLDRLARPQMGSETTANAGVRVRDNILDLTHADYLHSTTLGRDSVTRSKVRIEERDDSTVLIEWLANDEVALPFVQTKCPTPHAATDMCPASYGTRTVFMTLRFGATPAGGARAESIRGPPISPHRNRHARPIIFTSTRANSE